ncbi:hypothetical protein PCE1_000724 [Barthelona sp. PCE]
MVFSFTCFISVDIQLSTYEHCLNVTDTSFDRDWCTYREPMFDIAPKTRELLWESVYWTMQIFTWIVIPFMQEYENSAGFTVWERIKYSLIVNGIYYAVLIVLGGIGAIFILAKSGVGNFWEWIMDLANAWGILLLILTLSYGLVKFPSQAIRYIRWEYRRLRALRKVESLDNKLKAKSKACGNDVKHFKKVLKLFPVGSKIGIHEERLETARQGVMSLLLVGPLEKEVICGFKAEKSIIDKVKSKKAKKIFGFLKKIVGGQEFPDHISQSPEKLREEILKAYVALKKSLQALKVADARMYDCIDDFIRSDENLLNIKFKNDQNKLDTTETELLLSHKAWRPKKAGWFFESRLYPNNIPTFGKKVRFYFVKFLYRPIFILYFAILLILSTLVSLSQFGTFNPRSWSVLHMIIAPITNPSIASILITIVVIYIACCSYSALFKLRMFSYYELVPNKRTDGFSLLFSAAYLQRLVAPICINLVAFLGVPPTSFSAVFGKIDTINILGRNITTAFPLLIVFIEVLFIFKLPNKLLSICGTSIVDEDELSSSHRAIMEEKISTLLDNSDEQEKEAENISRGLKRSWANV